MPSILLSNKTAEASSVSEASEASKLSESMGGLSMIPDGALEPIAIIGFSLKFPQEATSPESFWSMLMDKRCAMTEWPKDRLNLEAFYHPDKNRNDTLPVRGAHFIKEDVRAFDASFFSIVNAESMCMDPQHRMLLETTYRALENAGISMEKAAATQTGVYTGAFTDDFKLMIQRDIEVLPKYALTGSSLSLLANRISWFFNLRGPSMNIDTACSSSMVALDLACQGLRNRDTGMAIVAASNLVLGLENMLTMSNMNFFSPDSKCFSFDSRANGYARGEGFGVLVLKRLSDALEHGETIRAVIRSTGSNQDGRTPGITQPSSQAQVTLIKSTYHKAGLDMSSTRFFEAHGTGTAIGDPTEADAIGEVFRKVRSANDPLYIGAVKSNIGHLESASGIAGIIKSILVLEKGVIPPNTNFQQLNPRIDAEFLNLRFPAVATPWPTKGLRRASVNAFGFGGSNSHVVLDDAYNYLRLHGLKGNHNSVAEPPPLEAKPEPVSLGVNGHNKDIDGVFLNGSDPSRNGTISNLYTDLAADSACPKLLVWSAADEDGLRRLSELYNAYLKNRFHSRLSHPQRVSLLDNLAYTLACRRTTLPWKAFTLANSRQEMFAKGVVFSPPKRSSDKLGIAYVFTGQGAQYPEMGKELLAYKPFKMTLLAAEQILRGLGCEWSLVDELLKPSSESRINMPAISQPLCTAVQLALVDLLRTFGITPSAVVGHSSGEIAAAYSIGAISFASACRLAYFRGKFASTLSNIPGSSYRGAMISVELNEHAALQYIKRLKPSLFEATVACVNSGSNVTVSGEETSIDSLQAILDAEGIFARKLMVDVAYHSAQMNQIAAEYLESIQGLEVGKPSLGSPSMISSVTGQRITHVELVESEYWVRNMVSQVRFSEAVMQLMIPPAVSKKKLGVIRQEARATHHFLEVGPHSALRAPLRVILNSLNRGKEISYDSLLVRKSSALQTTLEALGRLHCLGYRISFDQVNQTGYHPQNLKLLTDLPEYPFDHSQKYWYESRISENYRFRKHPRLDLLGTRVPDWNPLEARWRKIIRISETPWVQDHKVNGAIIFPAAALFVMAIEAARQMAHESHKVKGYLIQDTTFHHAVTIATDQNELELQFHLRPTGDTLDKSSSWSDFRIYMYENARWVENCRGLVKVEYEETEGEGSIALGMEEDLRQTYYKQLWEEKQRICTKSIVADKMYQHFLDIGIGYGPAFQALQSIRSNGFGEATAEVLTFDWSSHEDAHYVQDHIIHPVTLDAAAQLIFVALTAGAAKTVATAIPTRVRNLWVSSSGLSYPSTTSINAYTKSAFKDRRTTESSLFGLDAATGELRLMISDLETTTVASRDSGSAAQAVQTQLCSSLVLKPDVEILSRNDLLTRCKPCGKEEPEPIEFYQDLGFLSFTFLSRALTELSVPQQENLPSNHEKYVAWMRLQVDKYHDKKLAYTANDWQSLSKDSIYVETVTKRVAAGGAEGRLFATIGSNLLAIIRGEVDPLSLLFEDRMAEEYYQEIFNSPCCQSMTAYIDLLAHKNPGMKIIEVGAGTGGMTRQVLSALKLSDLDGSLARYAQYDYTDISGAYFEKAEAELSPLNPNMKFTILDIEFDPHKQGLEPGTYDLVVAGLVLHATRNLEITLRNVRKLLKPYVLPEHAELDEPAHDYSGGKLLMFEIVVPDMHRTGFVFGLLPGWWLGTEKLREWSACVSEKDWHDLLIRTGFSGIDIAFHDYQQASCHEKSLIISSAQSESSLVGVLNSALQIYIVIDASFSAQLNFAQDIQNRLNPNNPGQCSIVSLREAAQLTESSSEYFVVYLLELEEPFLYDIDEADFDLLQKSLLYPRRVLWITPAGGDSPSHPGHGMFNGLARTLRSENIQLLCVSLALDRTAGLGMKADNESHVMYVVDILHKMVSRKIDDMEPEYIERDGLLCINRIIPSTHLNRAVHTFDKPQQREQPFGHGSQLTLTVANPGMSHSLLFIEDEKYSRPLAPGEVEIEVKSAGITFTDCLTVLGRLKKDTIGEECTGVVSRVGLACVNDFQPGDRVCAAVLDCFRTFVRSDSMLVTKIPPSLSFQDASSVPVAGVTAHYALIETARLRSGETTLIHAAAEATGQFAIQMAQEIGAVVYVTVDTHEKKLLLKETYGIPEDHILSSHNVSFAQGIMRLTRNKGVDVILNSLSGELLTASWDCIASFGRFIEIGKKDIDSHANLPMFPFRKNVSFGAVDLDHLRNERPMAFRKSLLAVIKMLTEYHVKVPTPLHNYSISDIEAAFQFTQSGEHTGKTVVDFQTEAPVQTLLKTQPTYSFDANASYLIVGGLGGVGRSIARWLAHRGARNLILLSRSGASSEAASSLLAELHVIGIRVKAPSCDVTDSEALTRTLADCAESGMPPIKGCIQSAMVLHDALFPNMSFAAWQAATAPKVRASWNLHQLLPDLTFFILLSSISGALGNAGQANYAAGNTYQDALAVYRNARGQPTISLDLGWITSVGAIAESVRLQKGVANRSYLLPISESDLLALLDYYCSPHLPIQVGTAAQSIIGLATPAAAGTSDLPHFFRTPPYRILHQVERGSAGPPGARKAAVNYATLFAACETLAEAEEVVMQGLARKLAAALGMPAGDIDTAKPLHAYGVDSLLAIELRNWFGQEIGTEVAIFDIMSGQSIAEVAALVTGRSRWRKGEWE